MLSYQAYVQSVQQKVTEIDIHTLQQNINHNMLLIDIRESEELKAGKIPNAKPIPRGVLEAKIITLSPANDEDATKKWLSEQNIILYCASGARSALATQSLNEMGLSNVSSLSGGFNAWQKQGYPVAD